MIFMPSSCGLGHFHATYPSLPKCGTCRWHTLQIKLKSIARNVSRLIRLDLWMSFGPLEVHLLMACGVYHGRHRSKHRTQPFSGRKRSTFRPSEPLGAPCGMRHPSLPSRPWLPRAGRPRGGGPLRTTKLQNQPTSCSSQLFKVVQG